MGVIEQRYSSLLFRIFVLLSLVMPPVAMPSDKSAHEDPHTAVRLPPALEAMLIVLIGTANFHRPGAVEFLDHKNIERRDQILRFKAFIKEMIRVYKAPKDYNGPKIQSLGQYVRLVEPTRVHTGSLRGDMEALFRRMETRDLPPAVRVKFKTQFEDNVALVDAELFEADKSSRLQSLLHSFVGDTSFSPTIVGTVLTGALGALFTTRGGVSLVRAFSNQMNGENVGEVAEEAAVAEEASPAVALTPLAPLPANASSKQKQQWAEANRRQLEQQRNAPPAAKPGSRALVTAPSQSKTLASMSIGALATTAGIGALSRSTADFLDAYHHLGESEGAVLDVLERLDSAETSDHERILNQFHQRIHDVVLPQIYNIGTTAAQSPQIQGLAETDPRVQKLITVFFDDYLKLLPSDVIKDIILDLGRAPRDTTDYQSLGLVLKHYPPIAQQFFQTVAKMAGLGSFSKMFKQIRDDGWEVPLDQIERIIMEDPNHYPLSNIRLSGKAGKLFQLVYADYTDEQGAVTQVAVRVLKPGVEKLLESERVILHKLADQLSQALRHHGAGPSRRRLEQLVDMIYWNLREELRIDRTVANQNEGAKRLQRRIEIKVEPHDKAYLNIKVPRAYPAKPGSRVMVMERVMKIASMENIQTWYSDLPGGLADALMDLMVEELMIKPMEHAQSPKKDTERPHPEEGFMHVDLHSGNLLLEEPNMEGDVPEYNAVIVDFGLVSWVKQDQVADLVKLSVGASYNSAPFITEALWSLRDPKMQEWDKRRLEKAQAELSRLVSEKATELNRKPDYWSTADWVKYIWEQEVVDFPAALISLEQGFRAARSSYIELGRDPKDVERREASYAVNYRDLFSKYLRQRTGLTHPGWRPVFAYETMGCIKRLLGYK